MRQGFPFASDNILLSCLCSYYMLPLVTLCIFKLSKYVVFGTAESRPGKWLLKTPTSVIFLVNINLAWQLKRFLFWTLFFGILDNEKKNVLRRKMLWNNCQEEGTSLVLVMFISILKEKKNEENKTPWSLKLNIKWNLQKKGFYFLLI